MIQATFERRFEYPEQARYEVSIQEGANQRRDFKNIVIAGMGGSALAADMVRVLTAGWLHIPLEVVKGYDLPGFVGEETLVIAVSHSAYRGDSELLSASIGEEGVFGGYVRLAGTLS